MNSERPARVRTLKPLVLSLLLLMAMPLACAADAPFKLGDRLAPAGGKATPAYRELTWYQLTPAEWDPMAGVKREDIARMRDGDPRATALLKKLQDAWKNAPTVPELDKQAVRIAGFLVPLDADRNTVREFLLVPYFGACIHTPPPPSNQAIHVKMDKPFKGRMMEAFWISGTLHIEQGESPFGATAYRMQGRGTEPYQMPDR
ncbi:DUF3299 domain-containing protein [Uliginosibacterium flavum]|uniref:DUF3299 domain-containing protein n=1 Tax=Uliginosibacterium flavum TaxID=1396831 RepID=A0ABV2TR24_9RHOO